MSASPPLHPLDWRALARDLMGLGEARDLDALTEGARPLVLALGGRLLALARVTAGVQPPMRTLLAGVYPATWREGFGDDRLDDIARRAAEAEGPFAIDRADADGDPREGVAAGAKAETSSGTAYPYRRSLSSEVDVVLFAGPHLHADAEMQAQRRLLADAFRARALARLPPACAPPRLTQRQRACLAAAEQGRNSIEIGAALQLAPRTVDAYLAAAAARLGARNRTAAVTTALRLGLL